MKKYNIIALCGKSGSGKNYLFSKLKKYYYNKLNYIVPCTTRPIRENETEGYDYHFLTKDEFLKQKDSFIETTSFNNWWYGTPISSLELNKFNLGIFNPFSVEQLFARDDLNIHLFYIYADDKMRVIRQLTREEEPDVNEICRRFIEDEKDFQYLLSTFPFRQISNSSSFLEGSPQNLLYRYIDRLLLDSDKIN